jgi:predicted nucleotidyltransferase component of viral defense system
VLAEREIVEIFHLEFVRVLATTHAHYAIKGGCNLRFFFGSVRYSEDIDFDVSVTSKSTLDKQVDGVLRSKALEHLLRLREISIDSLSKPKQTETTQRWKLALASKQTGAKINTKIEFSRRRANGAVEEPIDKSLLDGYRLSRINARHYPIDVAVAQKIEALVGRSEVQARDVFDLNLLLSVAQPRISVGADDLRRAADRAMEIGYDQYAAQVVSYLVPEHAAIFDSKSAWESMQLRVIEFLQEVRT